MHKKSPLSKTEKEAICAYESNPTQSRFFIRWGFKFIITGTVGSS